MAEKYTEYQVRILLDALRLPVDVIIRQVEAYSTGTWEVGAGTWIAVKRAGDVWRVRLIVKDLEAVGRG